MYGYNRLGSSRPSLLDVRYAGSSIYTDWCTSTASVIVDRYVSRARIDTAGYVAYRVCVPPQSPDMTSTVGGAGGAGFACGRDVARSSTTATPNAAVAVSAPVRGRTRLSQATTIE